MEHACLQRVGKEWRRSPQYFNILLGPVCVAMRSIAGREVDPPMPLKDVDLTIRHAQPGDAAALAQLMCELGYDTTKSEMQMRVQRIATDERYRTFVAVRDRKVCGMIGTLTYPSYEHNDPSGRILALAGIEYDAPPRNWSRADCNCVESFRPQRNQARRFGHTAGPRRCPQVLRIAWL